MSVFFSASGLHAGNPAAGISSNAVDMNKWLNFLLGVGPAELDHEAVSMTFVPEIVNSIDPYFSKPDDAETMHSQIYYARGWFSGHYKGKNFL